MIHFTFNGKCSKDFGILIEESNHNTKPPRRIEIIEVPGRTGNLIIDEGCRSNIDIVIVCHIEFDDGEQKIDTLNALDEWLNGEAGYKELKFNNGRKFKAIFTGELYLPDTDFFYTDFELTFNAYEEI